LYQNSNVIKVSAMRAIFFSHLICWLIDPNKIWWRV
jgi:hypothetical protein